jgi:predicted Zn-dependent protease with MMP-like domain
VAGGRGWTRPAATVTAVDVIEESRFERLVADALDALPDDIAAMLDNVVVMVEDEHPDEELYGLYEGIPQSERDDYGGFALPDRIILYRHTLCTDAVDLEALRDEVLITVVHELAHHFGINDERLHELGWG